MRRALAITIAMILMAAPAFSANPELTELSLGARYMGMGRAGTGYGRDAASMFLNPAGPYGIEKLNILSSLSNPMQDVNVINLVGVIPDVWEGNVGLGYIFSGFSNIIHGTDTIFFGEHEFIFNYSRSVEAIADFKTPGLALGGNFKFFTQGYSKDAPDLRRESGSGFDLDLGAKYEYSNWLGFGLQLMNIVPASMGAKMSYQDGSSEGIPSALRIGTGVKLWGDNAAFEYSEQELFAAFDFEMLPTRRAPIMLHAGLEWKPVDFMTLRTGIDQRPHPDEVSIVPNYSFGLGMAWDGFTADYAFYKINDSPGAPTVHHFSIGYFGFDPKPEPVVVLVTPEVVPETIGIRTMKRKRFIDVPKTHWAVDPIELLATAGLLSGYRDNTYRPEKEVPRSDFSLMILNVKNLAFPDVTGTVFQDVEAESPVAQQVKAVKDVGAMVGYPDWRFRPFTPITRAEALKVFMSLEKDAVDYTVRTTPFDDVTPDHWAAPYVAAAAQKGFISTATNMFNPSQRISRAELASMLFKTTYGQAAVKRLPPLED